MSISIDGSIFRVLFPLFFLFIRTIQRTISIHICKHILGKICIQQSYTFKWPAVLYLCLFLFCFGFIFFFRNFFFFSLESCCYCCLSQKNKQTNRMIFFKYEILWKRFSVWLFFFSHKSVYFVNGKEDVRYISKNCLQFFVVVFVLNVLSYLNFNFSWIAMICLCVQKLQQTKHTIIFELGVVLCCCKSLSNLLGLGREEGERQKDW